MSLPSAVSPLTSCGSAILTTILISVANCWLVKFAILIHSIFSLLEDAADLKLISYRYEDSEPASDEEDEEDDEEVVAGEEEEENANEDQGTTELFLHPSPTIHCPERAISKLIPSTLISTRH